MTETLRSGQPGRWATRLRPVALALGLTAICTGPALAQTAASDAPASKPNILLIVSDDTGWGDLAPISVGRGAA